MYMYVCILAYTAIVIVDTCIYAPLLTKLLPHRLGYSMKWGVAGPL